MLQYLLTGLAGLALGIAGMRVWQARELPDGKVDGPAPSADAAPTQSPSRMLLIGTCGLLAVAAAVLAFRSGNDIGAGSSAASMPGQAGASPALDDVDTAIGRLAERLKTDTKDGEGFRMLGWSYLMTGHPDQAIAPYKRALQLLPSNATVHAGYAEALVGVAGGKVTVEAKSEIDKALALDRNEPRARYFAALWLAQNGKPKDALDQWIALTNSGAAEAPWQADVRRQIGETAGKLGIDVSARLKPAPAGQAAIAGVPAAGQAPPASPDQMVAGLAARLVTNPRDPAGWSMLLRSRMVLHQDEQAAKDLVTARKALADDGAGLAQVNAAAQAAGVPGA